MYKNIQMLAEYYDKSVAIIDTETTGLGDPDTIDIVDIAILVIHKSGAMKTIESLINPGRPIPFAATKIHGIDNTMVKKAPSFSWLAGHINSILNTTLISGFNSQSYDTPIIRARIKECIGKEACHSDHLDARMVWTNGDIRGKGKLHEVAAFYDIPVEISHRAMADVITAAKILDCMIEVKGLNEVCKFYSPAQKPEPIPRQPFSRKIFTRPFAPK